MSSEAGNKGNRVWIERAEPIGADLIAGAALVHIANRGLELETKIQKAVAAIQRHPESLPRRKDTGFRKFFAERFPLQFSIWI